MSFYSSSLGALALANVAFPVAGTPLELRLSAPWEINYDKDSCHLIGQFGTGGDRIVARFTRYAPGDLFDLALVGERLKTAPWPKVRYDFGLAERPAEKVAVAGTLGELPLLQLSAIRVDGWNGDPGDKDAPPVSPVQEAGVAGVTLGLPGRPPVRLVFGSLGKPMAALRTCTAHLVRSWGYDPDVQSTLSRPLEPATPPREWVTYRDYPRGALTARNDGLVQFRLDVDATGRVSACHVLARTEPDAFGDLTCRLMMRRAGFRPALDAHGEAVPAYFVSRVTWRTGR